MGKSKRRYSVTLAVPKIGPVKHVIKAANAGEAQARAMAAHPGAVVMTSKRIEEGGE